MRGYKAVSGYYPSYKTIVFRIDFLIYLYSEFQKTRVRIISHFLIARHLPEGIIKACHIHIVLQGIPRNHEVKDMHRRRNRSGNPGIKNIARLKAVNQGLGTSCRIALSNPCTNQHDILSGELPFIKTIGTLYDFFPLFAELNQVSNLFFHGTDDSNHFLSFFSTLRFFFLHDASFFYTTIFHPKPTE